MFGSASTGHGASSLWYISKRAMDLSKLFDDTQALILTKLQAEHLEEVHELKSKVTALEAALQHERGIVGDMILSHFEGGGGETAVCFDCRGVFAAEDTVSCDQCHYIFCHECNAASQHAFGRRDIEEEEEEVCLWCEEREQMILC